jgi:DNA polymerase beta
MANNNIINEFKKLIKQIQIDIDIKNDLKDQFRLNNIYRSLSIIKNYPDKIKSGEQLQHIKGIGKGTISRIDEILKTGKLSEIITVNNDYTIFIDELEKVIGIGRKTAYDLYKKHNIKSVKELKKAHDNNKIKLNDQILLGLKYHNVYKQDIPRKEIMNVDKFLHTNISKIDPELHLIIAGSYRREKLRSNDIDVLITHPDIKTDKQLCSSNNYLHQFVTNLKTNKFIIDDMTNKNYKNKYMGFCKYKVGKSYVIRRIDIRYIPYDSYYTALLYFTGSKDFNKQMRYLAIQLGYTLNEYKLCKLKSKKCIKIKSEKQVFDILDMEYVEPKFR